MASETVTVQVWEARSFVEVDTLVENEDPDEYELEPADPLGRYPYSDEVRAHLAESIENHQTYAFSIAEGDRPATLYVHTNDSYHDPHEWGRPIEQGLTFNAGGIPPYKCEAWGRIMCWVGVPDNVE